MSEKVPKNNFGIKNLEDAVTYFEKQIAEIRENKRETGTLISLSSSQKQLLTKEQLFDLISKFQEEENTLLGIIKSIKSEPGHISAINSLSHTVQEIENSILPIENQIGMENVITKDQRLKANIYKRILTLFPRTLH